MNLSDADDGEVVTLSCGCEVQRREQGENGFVRVHMMSPICSKHDDWLGTIYPVRGDEPVRDLRGAVIRLRRAMDLSKRTGENSDQNLDNEQPIRAMRL